MIYISYNAPIHRYVIQCIVYQNPLTQRTSDHHRGSHSGRVNYYSDGTATAQNMSGHSWELPSEPTAHSSESSLCRIFILRGWSWFLGNRQVSFRASSVEWRLWSSRVIMFGVNNQRVDLESLLILLCGLEAGPERCATLFCISGPVVEGTVTCLVEQVKS